MSKILLIEDDDTLAKEILATFREEDLEVVRGKTVDDAKKLLNEHVIGLAFLDIMLQGVEDGYTILSYMKGDPAYEKIPVIMLTNLSTMDKMDQATDLGATDYVIKANIDLDRLIEITYRYLQEETLIF